VPLIICDSVTRLMPVFLATDEMFRSSNISRILLRDNILRFSIPFIPCGKIDNYALHYKLASVNKIYKLRRK